jgi:hypothetical protein
MSIISASTLTSTALQYTADTTGTLVFQTGATPTTALTINSDQTFAFAGALQSPTIITPTIDKINTSVANTSLGAGNASIMKNRIINGAMVIDQRNAGASSTAEGYLVDRWRVWRNQTYSIQQSTDAPVGFSNSLAVTKTSTAQSTYAYLVQYIEGFNFSDMYFGTANAKTITISFWVKSSVTGTFSAGLINSASNRSYPATYTISSANTWTQASVTIAGDTTGTWIGSTNGTGAGVWFNFGGNGTAAANSWNASDATSGVTGNANLGTTNGATFYITGVQLEVGSSATGFEYRQYQQELALCERYYYHTFSNGASPASPNSLAVSQLNNYFGTNSNDVICTTYYPVTMRSAPTIALYAPLTSPALGNVRQSNNGSIVAGSALFIGEKGFTPSATSFVANVSYQYGYTASAEL